LPDRKRGILAYKPTEKSRVPVLLVLLSLLVAAGCGKHEETQAGGAQYYELKGQILAVDTSAKRLTIAHEEIPHYMKAMTMTFRVKDASLLHGVEPGDSVRGVLAVHRPDVWIDSLAVLGKMSSETHH
jgi:Cu/Ag efflux protein CusF